MNSVLQLSSTPARIACPARGTRAGTSQNEGQLDRRVGLRSCPLHGCPPPSVWPRLSRGDSRDDHSGDTGHPDRNRNGWRPRRGAKRSASRNEKLPKRSQMNVRCNSQVAIELCIGTSEHRLQKQTQFPRGVGTGPALGIRRYSSPITLQPAPARLASRRAGQ
jgi:hypothetical protein